MAFPADTGNERKITCQHVLLAGVASRTPVIKMLTELACACSLRGSDLPLIFAQDDENDINE